MPDPLYNATCIILEPHMQPLSTDDLQRRHFELARAPQRCSLRSMSVGKQSTVLGTVGQKAYACRVRTALAVTPGWRVQVLPDGADAWETCEVLNVSEGFCKNLTLGGTGG